MQGLQYCGGGGGGGAQRGANSQQAGNDVASTSFQRHVPNRFSIKQCQIITFLILKKSDNIENSRIKLKGIVGKYLQIK